MTRTTARLGGLAAALIAGTLVLTGCADDSADVTGHSSMTSSAEATSGSAATANHADVAFAQQMIEHHLQAILMAELAETRAADPRVLDLAGRIEDAQQPEIDTLTGWLTDWGADAGDNVNDGMEHEDAGDMGGMLSREDLQVLMNATGADFDRLFLQKMVEHHKGAVEMAMTESAEGQNPEAVAMAESIRDSQSAEIAEMQQLLTELGG
jgi:uncharacterized protein (DUF305 family)